MKAAFLALALTSGLLAQSAPITQAKMQPAQLNEIESLALDNAHLKLQLVITQIIHNHPGCKYELNSQMILCPAPEPPPTPQKPEAKSPSK